MNFKKLLIGSFLALIAVFIFEFLYHGLLMKSLYTSTASVWRPEEECSMLAMLSSQFLFCMAMTFGYLKVKASLTCSNGIQYGVITGLILGTPQIASFSYLPIPFSISALWVLGALLKCLVASVVIAKVIQKK